MLRPAALAPAPAKKLSNLLWPIVDQSIFQDLGRPKRDYGGYFANKKKREEKGQLPHRKIGDQYNLKTKLGAKILEAS